MNTETGSALVKVIERRIAAEVAPLRERVAALEAEVKALRGREPSRPGFFGKLTGAFSGGSR